MELKEQIKQELLEKKEQERLERVKANSKLNEVVLLTDNSPYCDTIKKELDQEGIKYKEETNQEEINKAIAITNLNTFPMVYVSGVYLVSRRDYNNPQQLIQGITHLAKPDFKNPTSDLKVIEHIKTVQFHLWQKLNQLESKLNPINKFIQNIEKEIIEEDKK